MGTKNHRIIPKAPCDRTDGAGKEPTETHKPGRFSPITTWGLFFGGGGDPDPVWAVSTQGFPTASLTCAAARSALRVHSPAFARGQSPGPISGAGSTRRASALPVTGPDTGRDRLFLLSRGPKPRTVSEEPETRAPASRNRDGLAVTPAGSVPGAGRGMSAGRRVAPQATSPRAAAGADKDRIPSSRPGRGQSPWVNHQPGDWKIPFPASPRGFRNQTPLSILVPRAAPARRPDTTVTARAATQGAAVNAAQVRLVVSKRVVPPKPELFSSTRSWDKYFPGGNERGARKSPGGVTWLRHKPRGPQRLWFHPKAGNPPTCPPLLGSTGQVGQRKHERATSHRPPQRDGNTSRPAKGDAEEGTGGMP